MGERVVLTRIRRRPIFYIIYKSDLKVLSACNKLSKCADDINLIVPEYTDVCLADEY